MKARRNARTLWTHAVISMQMESFDSLVGGIVSSARAAARPMLNRESSGC